MCPDDESGRCACEDSQAFRLSPSIIVMAIDQSVQVFTLAFFMHNYNAALN